MKSALGKSGKIEPPCPRCKRGTVVFETWGAHDVVAVCRHVNKCGYREHWTGGALKAPMERWSWLASRRPA